MKYYTKRWKPLPRNLTFYVHGSFLSFNGISATFTTAPTETQSHGGNTYHFLKVKTHPRKRLLTCQVAMEVKSILLWKHLPRKLPRTLPWKLFSRKISRLFEETFQQRFDGGLHETFFRIYVQGGLDGSSWELFFHGSYFHGSYFHERLDGSFHESFHELHAETASRLQMLPSNLPFKLPHI